MSLWCSPENVLGGLTFLCFFLLFFFQRSADWFDEDTLFTSGLTVCPLNAKVNEMAEGMFSQSWLQLKLHVCPKGYCFCAFLVWKRDRFCPFWSGIGNGFRENWGSVGTYLSFQFQRRKKEEYANSKWIWRIFCLHSNLSNDDIIFFLKARSEKGCGKLHFWSEIGSGFGEPGGTPPPRIPRSTPPGKWPPPRKKELCQGGYCWTLLCQDKRSILC